MRKSVKCNLALLILFFSFNIHLFAQSDSTKTKEPTTFLSGYIKALPSLINSSIADQTFYDLLLHNRLNFEWFPNNKWTFKASLRSRLFLGDQVSQSPSFGELVDGGANDWLDLSASILDSKSAFLHSYFDRFYLEYNTGQWEIKLGRQRINWGISTIWNPHDVFNAYAFTDFDYEERPGSDALRIKRYIGYSGSIELAVSPGDSIGSSTAALLYKFSRWNYDFQFLSGAVDQDFVFGLGWAGNIKTAGFKTEMSYFAPLVDGRKSAFSASINFDYALAFGLYVNAGLLYNSEGGVDQGISELFNSQLSARNLYPYRWSILLTGGSPISPIMSISLTGVYSPVKSNALFLVPTYTISVAKDWDVDFVMQLLFEASDNKYRSPIQGYFVRGKWSF